MYDLKKMNELTLEYETNLINHFEDFFKKLIKDDKINIKDTKIKVVKIESYDDTVQLNNNPGFYVVLTDYMLKSNTCSCSYRSDENKYVKAIYRGEANKRRERIIGHLFKDKYEGDNTEFMKIGNENGININKKPYCNYTWYVLMCSMHGSKQTLRLCVEKAFDSVFTKPMYSIR